MTLGLPRSSLTFKLDSILTGLRLVSLCQLLKVKVIGAVISFVSSVSRLKEDDQSADFLRLVAFKDLKRGSAGVVNSLRKLVQTNHPIERQLCVGLICGSSENFLFAWLGLMRAGFVVLLIAQVNP